MTSSSQRTRCETGLTGNGLCVALVDGASVGAVRDAMRDARSCATRFAELVQVRDVQRTLRETWVRLPQGLCAREITSKLLHFVKFGQFCCFCCLGENEL